MKSQRKLLHLYRRNALRGNDTNQEAKRRRLEDAWLQWFGHFQLHIAENDSFEMVETRHHWHHFMHLTAAQIETLEGLRESLVQIQELELKRFLPYKEENVTCEEKTGLPSGKRGGDDTVLSGERECLPELINLLDGEIIPRWEEIREVYYIDDIVDFGMRLNHIAREYRIDFLEDYSQKLCGYARNNDIDNMVCFFIIENF